MLYFQFTTAKLPLLFRMLVTVPPPNSHGIFFGHRSRNQDESCGSLTAVCEDNPPASAPCSPGLGTPLLHDDAGRPPTFTTETREDGRQAEAWHPPPIQPGPGGALVPWPLAPATAIHGGPKPPPFLLFCSSLIHYHYSTDACL